MTGPGPDGFGLLERAIGYALGSVQAVTPDLLSRPTPCGDWDLLMLLRHTNESLAALHEGIDAGRVMLTPAPSAEDPADPVADFRVRATGLLGAWAGAGRDHRMIAIADCALTTVLVAAAGALEIAVHGWDVSYACGQRRPIPRELAVALSRISPLLVTDDCRGTLFAPPIMVSPSAGPSDHLVGFLGRVP